MEFNIVENNNTQISYKKNIFLDFNSILNIITHKVNNGQYISEAMIEEICVSVKKYCSNHNDALKEWFNDDYKCDLNSLKNNNSNYSQFIKEYHNASFLFINE